MKVLISFVIFIFLIYGYIKSKGSPEYLFALSIVLFLLRYEENIYLTILFAGFIFITSILGFVFLKGIDRFISLLSFFVFSATAYILIKNDEEIRYRLNYMNPQVEKIESLIEQTKERMELMSIKLEGLNRYMKNLEYMRVFAAELLRAKTVNDIKAIVEKEIILLGKRGFFNLKEKNGNFSGFKVIDSKKYAISTLQCEEYSIEVGIEAVDESDLRIASSISEISKLAVENIMLIEKEKVLSIIDTLTNVYNRREIEAILKREFERYLRRGKLSIALIDVYNFKKINDTYGHQAGDIVLVELAKLVTKNIRETDFFGRFGGEEFLLILTSSDEKAALSVCEHLRTKISQERINIGGVFIKITVSIGIATLRSQNSYKVLLEEADKALYEAKRSGKNKVCII
ncbi:MAG: GGDEF domain-containing protein [bacterium]|nr:GGDEF domain-containing protein [bacterium]